MSDATIMTTAGAPCADTPRLFRGLLKVPFLGWQLEGLCRPELAGKLLALANILMAWLLAILAFGYPAFIIPVYAMVPLMAFFIIALTRTKA